MRRRRTAAALVLASAVTPSAAFAEAREAPEAGGVAATTPDDASAQPSLRVGYGAMPGGLHVATAETLPQGTVELAALSGYGYRKGLLGPDHTFSRAIGDFAIA